jgi:tetratricopeptide (TPR) repeat protein
MLRRTRAPWAAMGLIAVAVTIPVASRANGDLYQLEGTLRQEDGKVLHGSRLTVWLCSTTSPFSTQALVDLAGHFKIKDVPPGEYTVNITVPHRGEFIQSIEIGPSFADGKRRVVKEFLFRRRRSGSDSHSVSMVTLSVPHEALSEYHKARNCLSKRDTEGALLHLNKAVEIAPQFAAAWNNLGTIAFQTKDMEKAEACFREALRQDPSSIPSLINLGGVLLSRGKTDEALEINKLAVQLRPDNALAQSQLGQNYFAVDKYEEAEYHLKRARALDQSHFTWPQLVLADIYQRRHDFPSLVRELEEFLRFHPDTTKAADVRRLLRYARSRILTEVAGKPNPNQ